MWLHSRTASRWPLAERRISAQAAVVADGSECWVAAGGCRQSRCAWPRSCMAAGKLAGQVPEVVVLSCGLAEHGGDADGERVAADAGEVFAKQVSCPPDITGGRGGDHFDVVAFPAHLLVAGTSACCSGDGVEVGDGEPESRVNVDRESQCRLGRGRSGGALCLPVPSGRPPVCGYHTAVDLNRRPGGSLVITVAGVLITHRPHERQVARVP